MRSTTGFFSGSISKPSGPTIRALGDVAVLNVERARGAGGEHVAGVPALDARVQGNEAGRNVRHVIDGVLRVDLAVVDALDLELETSGTSSGVTSWGPKEKNVGKFLTMVR